MQIWDLADPQCRGSLDKEGFFVAMKLISLAQNGIEPILNNLHHQVQSPNMVGF